MSDAADPSDRRRKRLIITGLAVLPVMIFLCSWLSMPGKSEPSELSEEAMEYLKDLNAGTPAAPDNAGVHVVVHKSRHELVLFREGRDPKTYRIALGAEPGPDKERRGDCRTPVGTFYVCQKNQKSRYYLFIAISYPNEQNAERGLRDGLISQAQHDAIVEAIHSRKTPPWETKLGGEIGIHGGGSAWDWTSGCVGVDNTDMRELYAEIPMGAEVRIEP